MPPLVPDELRALLQRMGWIFWEDRLPPNNPRKEILMLDLRYGNVFVGPASDFVWRIQESRMRGAKREALWTEWWMPVPVPPRAVLAQMLGGLK